MGYERSQTGLYRPFRRQTSDVSLSVINSPDLLLSRTNLTSDIPRPVRAMSDFFSSSLRLMHVDLPDHALPHGKSQSCGFIGVVFIDGFVQFGVVLCVVFFGDLGGFIPFGPDRIRLTVHIVQHCFSHAHLDPVRGGILPVGGLDVHEHIGHFRTEMDQQQGPRGIGIFHGPPSVFHRPGRPQCFLHLALGDPGSHPRHPGLVFINGAADGDGPQIGHDLRFPGQGLPPSRQRKQQTAGQQSPAEPPVFQHHDQTPPGMWFIVHRWSFIIKEPA